MSSNKVEITLEDQERINKFSRLNQRRHELNSEIKHFKKLKEDVEEASDEMMLADEETTRYVVGECFIHLENDDATARIEAYQEQLDEDVATAKEEVERVKGEMEGLKAQLYAKFGKTINLEDSFGDEDA